ncbi:hypothetical protein C7E12_22895, partial [Stenotrophomonas maltophilia]
RRRYDAGRFSFNVAKGRCETCEGEGFVSVELLFAATPDARRRRYDAGRFSFNVAKGRCETCEGEGFVSVELLF